MFGKYGMFGNIVEQLGCNNKRLRTFIIGNTFRGRDKLFNKADVF